MSSEPRSARSSKQSAAQSAATSHRLLLQEGMNGEPERGFLDRSKSHEDHPYVAQVVDATSNCPEKEPPKSSPNGPNLRDKGPRAFECCHASWAVTCKLLRRGLHHAQVAPSGLRHLDPARQSNPIASHEPALSSDEQAPAAVRERAHGSVYMIVTIVAD